MIINDVINNILPDVEKPARYIGNEINMVSKSAENYKMRFAICFPEVYELGMSHLGLQILYFFLNQRSDTYCERAFSPWIDMEMQMRKNKLPLFSLETWSPLSEFDFIGFTLQYEMTYTNLLNMLDLAGIPMFSRDRTQNMPIICAGGPCAYNPEPLADFIDFFYIGEGEANLNQILDIYMLNKQDNGTRDDFLYKILSVDGIYVPKFYDVSYSDTGLISEFKPNNAAAPAIVKKVIVTGLDSSFYPEKQLVPLIETVHDRVTLEVMRGCMRGCRFCQAGYVYRPLREKSCQTLISQSETLIESSGHEEISLVSLSTGDYSDFRQLAHGLLSKYSKDRVNISLPSLRIDAFSLEIMEKAQEVRKSSLTFAPEAGTQRLRDVINKGITEEEIFDGCKMAFNGGWDRVKLYYMIGLPTETEKDLLGIVQLSESIVSAYYKSGKRNRPVSVNVSTSCFSPKPFTPFQWEKQETYEEFMEKHKLIKKAFVKRQIKYNYNDAAISVLEGVISRGDRRVGGSILRAWQLGARFDGWTDHFKKDIWFKAFEETDVAIGFYSGRERDLDEILPWDHIDVGVSKSYLKKEREKAYNQEITANCKEKCQNCGAAAFGGGICLG